MACQSTRRKDYSWLNVSGTEGLHDTNHGSFSRRSAMRQKNGIGNQGTDRDLENFYFGRLEISNSGIVDPGFR